MKAFDVYLDKKLIDTVWFSGTAGECRTSLINHDGYDPRIAVISAGRNPNGSKK
jgi:hypothetical protein